MLAITPLVFLLLSAPQQPEDVLAHYVLDSKPATVTNTDVALEMAFHLRRRERGRQAAEMIVDTMITRSEAKRLGVMPTTIEVKAFWERLKQQFIAAGHKPEDFAAVRNTNEETWLSDLSVQIAQERLVRKELGLGDNEEVSGEMLKLWLSELKAAATIQTDPDLLPAGCAATVNGKAVPLIDLGFLLLRTSEDFERERFIRQVVYLEIIERMANKRYLTVSGTDIDLAIKARRAQAKKDPRFAAVPFEQLLEAEGMTIASLSNLRVFRSQILLDKLAISEFDDATLDKELATNRAAALAEAGPRRRLGIIFVRALKTPNALITRNFDDAMNYLAAARKRVEKDGFKMTASIESEHGPSKPKGGDVGWHRRGSKELPDEVLSAAFALKMQQISMPIRTDEGCYLVTVTDKEPTPNDAEMRRRLRIARAQQMSESILADAKINIVKANIADNDPSNSKHK
jgi:parvulin-like peptidyl-prolyl isomerase